MAQVFTFPVRAEGILVLEPDGLSDNLCDEDVLDEVVRFWHTLFASYVSSGLQVPLLLARAECHSAASR